MKEQTNIKITINEKLGSVSAILQIPDDAIALTLLAHGAGAGMTHAFLEDLSKRLLDRKIGVLRFQFPYMERGGRPSKPEKDHLAILKVLAFAKSISELPIFLSGKSYGGRMSSQTTSLHPQIEIKGLLFYGFPLHAPGKIGKNRADHLYSIEKPMLFLQGTRDSLANIDLMKEVVADCQHAHLNILEMADHSFKSPKKSGRSRDDNLNWLADKAHDFIKALV